jgi:hypothetical protein
MSMLFKYRGERGWALDELTFPGTQSRQAVTASPLISSAFANFPRGQLTWKPETRATTRSDRTAFIDQE